MSELRHDRASIRAHRERVIKKKKKLFDAIWVGGYLGDKDNFTHMKSSNWTTANTLGKLSKHSTHHHSCYMCTVRYERAKNKYQGIV